MARYAAPVSDPDHYLVLGVRPDATPEQVHDAWRFAIQAFHPDRFSDHALQEKADERTRRVNAAWQALGDPVARAAYDRSRGGYTAPTQTQIRQLPCPACASLAAIEDQAGQSVVVRCPACAEDFTAIVGTRLLGRPELTMRFLSGKYRLMLADGAGRLQSLQVRRLPQELALSDGDFISVVLASNGRSVRYIVVHGERTSIGWKIR